MTKATVGLAAVRAPLDADQGWVDNACRVASAAVAPGRSLAVLWTVAHEWTQMLPVEAWVTRAVLGPPASRPEMDGDEFSFFGNLVVRCYRGRPLVIARTLGVLIFRKRGQPAYSRRGDPGAPVKSDLLDTSAFSFTRDLANNTWNIQDFRAENEVIARLARLLCWSDEAVVEFTPENRRRLAVRNRRSADLIGVAAKYAYHWNRPTVVTSQLGFLDNV